MGGDLGGEDLDVEGGEADAEAEPDAGAEEDISI